MFLKSILRSGARIPAIVTASALALSACVSPSAGSNGLYATPIGNAPVTANPTPYSPALNCLAEYARNNHIVAPRIAIGRVSDYTGREEADGSGRKLTQGASLMAMSAFAKAGMPLVERFDTSVSELELRYANNRLITDNPSSAGNPPADYRRILAGQVPGSDFYIVGGITELNYNIRSDGADIAGGDHNPTGFRGSFHGRNFVMNIGLDMRLINTRTLEVVDVISYQKQIIGHEVSAGLFDFLNGNIFDVSGGSGALEPTQLAVRSLIERATVEMAANLYGMPGPEACMHQDPLNAPSTTGATGAFTPAYDNLGTNNGQTRQDPARWNAQRDTAAGRELRGRY